MMVRKLNIKDSLFSITISLLLVIIYNLRNLIDRFNVIYDSGKIFYSASFFLSEIIVSVLILFVVFQIAGLWTRLLKFISAILILLAVIYLYFLNKFGVIIDDAIIANAMDALGHVGDVLDISIIWYILFLLVIPIIIIYYLNITKSSLQKRSIAIVSCLILLPIFYLSFPPSIIISSTQSYAPINFISSIIKFESRIHAAAKIANSRVSLSNKYQFHYGKGLDDLNVILVIGESLRADHLGINGYERNTTPKLSKRSNIINFVAEASFNLTTPSVTSMLSHRTKAEFVDVPPEKSIVSVFRELGFQTKWYSAQSSKVFVNNMLSVMALEADEYFFRERLKQNVMSENLIYDDLLIPYLSKAINEKGNKFIILHTYGSHIPFYKRYPKEYIIYEPTCESKQFNKCSIISINNTYDNTILYTDYFLDRVLDTVSQKNAIVIYASDHGQLLGEGNKYANGNADTIGTIIHEVPMFLYMSDNVLDNKDYNKKFLSAKNKTKIKMSHDNIFDSLLDCSGIKSDLLRRRLSICSSQISGGAKQNGK